MKQIKDLRFNIDNKLHIIACDVGQGDAILIQKNTTQIYDLQIKPGDRIAQMVINKVERIQFEEVEELSDTERGDGGFGHTGKK